ncbi:MAG: hypothetical protein H3C43_04745 [Leptonema sp. (in: Bacteria)]|nr:hypothetical protein [Leptonema sp. (in: bacteria)]
MNKNRLFNLKFLRNLLIASLLFGTLTGCVSDLMEKQDAQIDIIVAIEVKRAECSTAPEIPLIVTDDVDRNAVAGCVIAILSEPCPFIRYPVYCIRIYKQNVPGTVDVKKYAL